MGIILNKPMQDARLRELIDQLLIPIGESFRNIPVHFGGPVEHGRGFVLHSADYESEISTLVVDADFALTATQDILEEFAQGRGPELAVMALGYAGWGPSQLEAEIGELGRPLIYPFFMARGWFTGQVLAKKARELGLEIDFRQTNHEGVLVDWLHEARSTGAKAVLLNAAAYTHTSVALLDAIKAIGVPVIEVHLSDPATREGFRHLSYVGMAAVDEVKGLGARGYAVALEKAAAL